MQFTGINYLNLPQVQNFYFELSNITVSDTGRADLFFYDKDGNNFGFQFISGYLFDNNKKIICSYNLLDSVNIVGFVSNNSLNYKINDISNQIPVTFTNLNLLYISSNSTAVNCDISCSSQPINYSVSFPATYAGGTELNGTINSDVKFKIYNPSSFFFNTYYDLLSLPSGQTIDIQSGSNSFTLKDIDPVQVQYLNQFQLGLTTTFDDIGGKIASYRNQLDNKNVLSLSDNQSNTYYQDAFFDGSYSGSSFVYSDVPVTYNFSLNASNISFDGDSFPSVLSVKYESLYPIDKSGYVSSYITGFNLTNSGLYSGAAPTVNFTQYYYVTGITRAFESFLFSTGCSSSLLTTFSGGIPSGNASGYLNLVNVYLSGIYSSGIGIFKAASSYSILSSGSGYRYAPNLLISTGGSCYNLPDFSGVEKGQFKKINGSGLLLSQAGGLTGYALTSGIIGAGGNITGYKVTGLNLTNIGYGYSTLFPPLVTFVRSTGDPLSNNASGNFKLKSTGLYDFTGFWNINSNAVPLSGYSYNNKNYYSGDFDIGIFQNNIVFQINLSGIDNTLPITGLLTVYLSDGVTGIMTQKQIFQSRSFISGYVPPPDYSSIFNQSQYNVQSLIN
jgi:hypothetical protein